LRFNAGIRRGRSSSEDLDSLGIVMKSLHMGPKRFLFRCYWFCCYCELSNEWK